MKSGRRECGPDNKNPDRGMMARERAPGTSPGGIVPARKMEGSPEQEGEIPVWLLRVIRQAIRYTLRVARKVSEG